MDEDRIRRGHAYADRESRERKAEKILRILEMVIPSRPVDSILEIGCGSGFITAWFARSFPDARVVGVDIRDERRDHSFEFHLVRSTEVPLESLTFDIVISNHVIEHVGETGAQIAHLREIRQLLKPVGIAYLATPWRFALLEPHYRLPFLGWSPQRVNDLYVKASRRGSWYDVTPTTRRGLRRMLDEAGAVGVDVTKQALQVAIDAQTAAHTPRLVAAQLSRLGSFLAPCSPSMVWLIARTTAGIPQSL